MEEIKKTFGRVANIIETAKSNAYHKVKEELIKMYWLVGQFVSEKVKGTSYGDAFKKITASENWSDSLTVVIMNVICLLREKHFLKEYMR